MKNILPLICSILFLTTSCGDNNEKLTSIEKGSKFPILSSYTEEEIDKENYHHIKKEDKELILKNDGTYELINKGTFFINGTCSSIENKDGKIYIKDFTNQEIGYFSKNKFYFIDLMFSCNYLETFDRNDPQKKDFTKAKHHYIYSYQNDLFQEDINFSFDLTSSPYTYQIETYFISYEKTGLFNINEQKTEFSCNYVIKNNYVILNKKVQRKNNEKFDMKSTYLKMDLKDNTYHEIFYNPLLLEYYKNKTYQVSNVDNMEVTLKDDAIEYVWNGIKYEKAYTDDDLSRSMSSNNNIILDIPWEFTFDFSYFEESNINVTLTYAQEMIPFIEKNYSLQHPDIFGDNLVTLECLKDGTIKLTKGEEVYKGTYKISSLFVDNQLENTLNVFLSERYTSLDNPSIRFARFDCSLNSNMEITSITPYNDLPIQDENIVSKKVIRSYM